MRRYLNAQYANPRGGAAMNGTDIWLSATVKRGKRPAPPTVTWFAKRAPFNSDAFFSADPEFTVPAGQDAAEQKWACVGLPNVAGSKWTFHVKSEKVGKDDKIIPIVGEVETWRRLFFDVKADDAGLRALFVQALPMIQAAFAEAFEEIVENRVWVADAPVRGKTVDKSTKDGRDQGTLYTVTLRRPTASSTSSPFNVRLAGGAANCGSAALAGDLLTVTLTPKATLDAVDCLTQLVVKNAAGETIVEFAKGGGMLDGALGNQATALAAIGIVAKRVDDRHLTLLLSAAPMSNRWNPPLRTWSTPRPVTVMEEMAAGFVDLELKISLSVMGGTAGRQIGDRPEFETFVAVGATELACVLCHELGHARGLVRAGSARKYDVSQQEFNSGVPRRPPAADNLANDLWYDSTFGGSGTHCSSGASPVDSCITRSKRTYSHAGAGPLCLMYHASVTGHIEAVRFCRVCILQLRRR